MIGQSGDQPLSRSALAARVAADIPAGAYVNLGIGQPTSVAEFLTDEQQVTLHTENGLLGMGPAARPGEVDPELINAGKVPVTERPGAAYFDSVESFAMMRGGHLDVCVLGAFQVSARGDLANCHVGDPAAIPAVGGAMDLAAGARKVFVMMSLFARNGSAKLVPECTYPLTARACVTRVYTEYGRLDIEPGGVVVVDTFGLSFEDLADRTALPLRRQ